MGTDTAHFSSIRVIGGTVITKRGCSRGNAPVFLTEQHTPEDQFVLKIKVLLRVLTLALMALLLAPNAKHRPKIALSIIVCMRKIYSPRTV